MKRAMLAIVIGIFLVLDIASAAELDFHVSSGEVWIGESIDFTCVVDGVTGDIDIIIEKEDFYQPLPIGSGDGNHTHRYTPQVLGTFEAYCSNGTVNSATDEFSVSALVTEITYLENVYSDEEVHLRCKVYRETSFLEEIKTNISFKLFLDDDKKTIDSPYWSSGEWYIYTQEANLGGKDYTLRLESLYLDKTNYTEITFQVNPALDFSLDFGPSEIKHGDTVTASVTAEYHGSDVYGSAGVVVTINGQVVTVTKTPTGFTFTAPSMNPGTYDLAVTLTHNDLHETITRNIHYVIPVHGTSYDANGKGVSVDLKFTKDTYSKTIKIAGGSYSDSLPFGTYTLEATYGGLKTRLTDVPVHSELSDFIRFDYFNILDAGGLNMVGGHVMEFSHTFNTAYIDASYEAAKVKDEKSLEVYRCDDWNFNSRKCSGSWVKVSSTIDEPSNRASFQVTSLSTFVIGEMKEMHVSASIDKSDYYFNQTIKLTGVVRDSNNKIVPDATVTYRIEGTQGSVRTTSNGIFSADITVPSKEGRNVLRLNATKQFYVPAGSDLDLNILRKREFNIISPMDTEIEGEAELELSLVNSGDSTLHDITITMTGLPLNSDYSPKTLTQLLSGQEAGIKITTTPDDSDKRIYTVAVLVESRELTFSDSFVITVKKEDQQDQNQTTTQPQSNETAHFILPEINLTGITSFFTADTTSLLNIGSIVASVIIITLLFIKANRKKKYTAITRYYITHILETIKKEVLKGEDTAGYIHEMEKPEKQPYDHISKPEPRKPSKPVHKKRKPKPRKPEPEYLELKPHETGVG